MMNERIRELAEQSEVWANQFEEHWGDSPDTYELFKQKFAELIVRECMDIVDNADMTELEGPDPEDVLYVACKQIREHFGVE